MKDNIISKNHLEKNKEKLNNQNPLGIEDFQNNFSKVKKITNSIFSGYFDKSILDIPRIKTLILLELLMITDQILEGGDKMPSIIGIRK
jgi:hypothetical protein